MKQTWKKILCIVLAVSLIAAVACVLAACQKKVIPVWGPSDHRALYEEALAQFEAEHKDELNGYTFQYDGSGDAGAYSAMNTNPQQGAGVYTFANDQMANLRLLGALSPVRGENLEWSKATFTEASVEATKMGNEYMSYPCQADNGYYMYYNKSAFRDTVIWDKENDCIKLDENYTFRNMYLALKSKPDQMEADGKTNWHNGIVTWAMGDSWYFSGIFFSVGGDYAVPYDDNGVQLGSECWFAYTTPEGITSWRDPKADFTIGNNAYECAKNSITETNEGDVSKHYLYSDGDKAPLNDNITTYTNPNNTIAYKTPLAAVVCGTWKAKELQEAWGDDYAATVLPYLENDAGEKFQMKNFAGYKNMGVNPLCTFATESAENLALLHKLAQYLLSVEVSVARYDSTGAGPANKEALKIDRIANDAALLALNAQYALDCKYPGGADKTYQEYVVKYDEKTKQITKTLVTKHGGDPVGENGKGFRTQDSVPANYWTPIQNFGNTMYKELSGQSKMDRFMNSITIKSYLAELQNDIYTSGQ